MYRVSNLLSVGHSHILTVNGAALDEVNPLKGNLRSIFLLTWMTYGQFDYQKIKYYFNP